MVGRKSLDISRGFSPENQWLEDEISPFWIRLVSGASKLLVSGEGKWFHGFTHLLCMVEVLRPFLFWLRWCLDIGHSTYNHPITVVGWRNPSTEVS